MDQESKKWLEKAKARSKEKFGVDIVGVDDEVLDKLLTKMLELAKAAEASALTAFAGVHSPPEGVASKRAGNNEIQ